MVLYIQYQITVVIVLAKTGIILALVRQYPQAPIQIHGRGRVRGNKKHASLLADSLSLLLKITNGDNMKDDKLMNKLMKALTEFLQAKTVESKTDNEFARRILYDENEAMCSEDSSWPTKFDEDWR